MQSPGNYLSARKVPRFNREFKQDKMIGTYGRQVAWNSSSASPPHGAPEDGLSFPRAGSVSLVLIRLA